MHKIIFLILIIFTGMAKADIIVEDANLVKKIEMPNPPTELETAKAYPRVVTEYVQLILRGVLNISDDLLNKITGTAPRIVLEYARAIIENNLTISEELLNKTREESAPRVVVEYSNKITKVSLVYPKELLNE
ncbi:MAG: hypothetical protein J7K36_10765 [Archaeoglobaceae archaeon]|nr:hypothetical protein [Archaeoglobaceae archaeon]